MWRNVAITYPRNCVRYLNSVTIDATELQHFKRFTSEWWDESGYLKALHALNKLRVPFIRDGIINSAVMLQEHINISLPIKGLSILEVGCGGGILTEPLARIGADVTGLDANPDLIERAKLHSKNDNLNIKYICSPVEKYAVVNVEKHDAIVASEILEHVTKKKEFLKHCVKCMKPGGSIFITTINKTVVAKLFGVVIAESFFKLLPEGTHQYDKFIEPHKLERILEELGCKTILTHGIFYNVLTNEWRWCSDDSINYALHAVKLK
ncbi:ubiquinone biosynthesis O-methyltransferase, mitochondrial [Tribolium castaneum]|uniref:Ubiquinone biosynthesis O-methyltransferase, mitochondrial n=1 Tax=Tribolium castaneum TaxID=7070 RepID=A0A139WE60_TRICA|nr:PREDICTED: ubiquinone biosynthesis O-methyltransferase, mitochondrial [Tribolium castaneum]XP_008195504.1 PREDICTED: ubiquinone biosynthesis O-methyltransferase, mitochondrial [Tribolium castaneum]KYB26214.1 Hexaprenyldihydroxybenzoate methyltransferase, mitochondrial-like Protein [Tribolium castaneum]|eukprot:XP_008195463.1 PREDICTED: ubiquinone biosynthesis O-methyltransferase, mitochondrial [Tribolium castaneum]